MEGLATFPLALFGQWHGAAGVVLVLVGAAIFLGTIYILLVAIYGWRQAYLVEMVALSGWIIMLSLIWLFGVPGTIPGTGPRGTEPHWVMFLPDSEQGREFVADIARFPSGWDKPDASRIYGGKVNAVGEIESIKSTVQPALAGFFQRQGTGSSKPADYRFLLPGKKPAADEVGVPPAVVAFKQSERLLVGIEIPETAKHPRIRVFGLRDTGRIFQPAAMFLGSSVVLFALHIFMLARMERRQRAREAQIAGGTAPREPAPVG